MKVNSKAALFVAIYGLLSIASGALAADFSCGGLIHQQNSMQMNNGGLLQNALSNWRVIAAGTVALSALSGIAYYYFKRRANIPATLHEAAAAGYRAVVQRLLDSGANVNAANSEGETPLSEAACKGHESTVRLLLDSGANVNAAGPYTTPLHRAAHEGHKSIIRLLLDSGAYVNVNATGTATTPLHWAVRVGHKSVVRLLLDSGAHVNAANSKGETPLHWAAREGHESVVRLLLDSDAHVNATDSERETPLHWAALSMAALEDRKSVVQLLLDSGANVNATDSRGKTPLHWAAREGHESTVRLLLGSVEFFKNIEKHCMIAPKRKNMTSSSSRYYHGKRVYQRSSLEQNFAIFGGAQGCLHR